MMQKEGKPLLDCGNKIDNGGDNDIGDDDEFDDHNDHDDTAEFFARILEIIQTHRMKEYEYG